MKKAIGFIVAWALYWLGDLVSRQMGEEGRGYWLYSWLMNASGNVQDWAGTKGPWVVLCKHYPFGEVDSGGVCGCGSEVSSRTLCSAEDEAICPYAKGGDNG